MLAAMTAFKIYNVIRLVIVLGGNIRVNQRLHFTLSLIKGVDRTVHIVHIVHFECFLEDRAGGKGIDLVCAGGPDGRDGDFGCLENTSESLDS